TAERHGAEIVRKLLTIAAPEGTLFNVNFPAVEADAVRGTKVTRQGKLDYALGIEERQDGRGLPYYWLKFGRQSGPDMEGSDLAALRDGFISVTPLQLDLTHHALREDMRSVFAAG
ncbi:5'/3'-nucleotidase SurE, partial [uncultured Aureimonas sp.]|uniref:5'/3'-nucleotidase SurE n=1 Tax=uncultured Aureimonas sp. TaxID=1604662 RepID=UPI0025E68342